jgi:uncharacterized protein
MDRLALTHRPEGQRLVMRQLWRQLLFLHWPLDPEQVQRFLPPGLTVDTFENQAYLGLVPFTMRGIRPVWAPAVPGLSNFHETNVRTYVHQKNKNPGVYFFSLDAANQIAVTIARTLWNLPYHFAQMQLTKNSQQIIYASTRHSDSAHTKICAELPSDTPRVATPGTLEHFLIERYLLYTHKNNTLLSGRVWHEPYQIQKATILEFDDQLCAAAGFPNLSPPPLAHFVAGVDVQIFPLSRCRDQSL